MAANKKQKNKPAKKATPKKVTAKKSSAKVAKPKATKTKIVKKVSPAKKAKSAKKTATNKKKPTKSSPKAVAKAKKLTPTKTASKKPAATKPTTAKTKAWMKPLDDRLLVELIEADQVSQGGIILVDSSIQPENLEGFVTAIGRGHQNKKGRIHPIELKVGDKIIFSKYAGDKVSHNGVNFVIIRETDVLGFAAN
ncbi:MAG: hypothetical protein RJB66_650 [Pseudomonadota bacterium]